MAAHHTPAHPGAARPAAADCKRLHTPVTPNIVVADNDRCGGGEQDAGGGFALIPGNLLI